MPLLPPPPPLPPLPVLRDPTHYSISMSSVIHRASVCERSTPNPNNLIMTMHHHTSRCITRSRARSARLMDCSSCRLPNELAILLPAMMSKMPTSTPAKHAIETRSKYSYSSIATQFFAAIEPARERGV